MPEMSKKKEIIALNLVARTCKKNSASVLIKIMAYFGTLCSMF